MIDSVKSYARRSGCFHFLTFGIVTLFCCATSTAQDFRISDFHLDANGKAQLRHSSETNSYYILYRSGTLSNIANPIEMALGTNGIATLSDPTLPNSSSAIFYRVGRVPVAQPLDT